MKEIKFTNKQFEQLMKLVYIGEWVVNAHRALNETIHEFEDIEQLVLSHAKEYGLDEFVDKDTESEKIYPSNKLEGDPIIRQYVGEYDRNTFWNELCSQLAIKDLVESQGEKLLSEMDDLERFKLLLDLEDKYRQEFQYNALDNLILKPKSE